MHQMFFKPAKVAKILTCQTGQDAVMAIDCLLAPRFYRDASELTAAELVFVHVEEMEREVNNGGYSQFFFNASGAYATETLTALAAIGAVNFQRLLAAAMAVFPGKLIPPDSVARQEIMAQIEDKAEIAWAHLDQEFYKYEENLTDLVLSYVRAHLAEFR